MPEPARDPILMPDTIVSSGQVLEVQSGVTSTGVTVLSGGYIHIDADGVASGTLVQAGGSAINYGVTASTSLAGGYEGVGAHAYALYTDVSNGATLHIDAQGVGLSTDLKSGGLEVVYSAGVESGATVLGTLFLSAGGSAEGSLVGSGGRIINYGVTSSAYLLEGYEGVGAGASAVSTTVDYGGNAHIDAGAEALDMLIYSSGSANVYASGVASNTTLSGGELPRGGDRRLHLHRQRRVRGGPIRRRRT